MEDEMMQPSRSGSNRTPGIHDNGADGTTDKSLKRKSKKSITKKMLLEELSAMRIELTQLRNEKDSLLQSTTMSNPANDFEPFRSNTAESYSAVGETLLASVNNMSLSTMSIPECIPSEGDSDIDKKGYEYWKNILLASLNLIQANDENMKMDVFRIKAGPKLLELLQGTKSSPDMPDQAIDPFSNALARLDCYFGSRAYTLSQRSKLLNTTQRDNESSIQFVRRVAASAKLCGYDKEDDEMEAVARTVIKSSTDKRVRTLAHRNWIRQGSLNDLIDLVRDHETELSNEQEFQKTRQPQRTASVAAISSKLNQRGQYHRNTTGRFTNMIRGRGSFHRNSMRYQGPTKCACWRCASIYHGPEQCPCIEKVCHSCKQQGHLARCCPSENRTRIPAKRLTSEDSEAPPRKIAAIKNEQETNVLESSDPRAITDLVVIDKVVSNSPMHQTEEDAFVIGRVAGTRVIFFIDSGAQVNTVTKTQFNKMLGKESTRTREFPKFNVPPVVLFYNKAMPPARNVYTHIPAAYKELAKRKLDEMLQSGIIEMVTDDMDRSFCSSLLAVPKGYNDIRLVVDLRGPNKCIYRTPFRMPTFEEILMELHGAKWFSTIDLKNAFFHVVLDEGCRHLTNFYSGEEIMQSTILSGCDGVVNYLDDVLVFGETKEEHDKTLN
ncbi:uncharacterized protein LOC134209503 [Armigeres subalbatus]|uniref:uncharacterized protein LOC134209503 n=1 Tax=Armigeres subalbatus TaxID=124917 RepID=UPI002ED3104E